MRVQLVSDIHLEFKDNLEYLKNYPFITQDEVDVLVIAGDFCPMSKRLSDDMQYFLDEICEKYKNTIIVNGNHDYYNNHVDRIVKEKTYLRDNIVVVNRDIVELNNVRFVCATLWGKPTQQEELNIVGCLRDFTVIYGMNMNKFKTMNRIDSNFIFEETNKNYDGKTVVVTHHIPSRTFIDEQYRNSNINGGFASSEEKTFSNYIDYWLYGHTHTSFDKTNMATRFLCNPLGYVRWFGKDFYKLENNFFNNNLVFEIN